MRKMKWLIYSILLSYRLQITMVSISCYNKIMNSEQVLVENISYYNILKVTLHLHGCVNVSTRYMRMVFDAHLSHAR